MSFGIALAGGGTRGAAHVGVLLALSEAGMLPRAVAGTSAGALVAGLYACGVAPTRLYDLVLRLARKPSTLIDPDYGGILRAIWELFARRILTLPGLLKGNRLERFLRGQIGDRALRDVPMRLIVPAVDVVTGDTVAYTNTRAGARPLPHVVWRDDAAVCTAIRASAAFPAVFRPVRRAALCLVDGGVADNLPVDLLLATGERRVLAVDVAEDYRAPCCDNLVEIASHSLTILGNRLKERIATGEQYRLCPALPEEAGLLTFGEMAACMEAGYAAAQKEMPTLRALFS